MPETKTTEYPIDMWRSIIAGSATCRRFFVKEILPDLDTLTPESLNEFVENSAAGEDYRSLFRFFLHLWDHQKFAFDFGDIVDWEEEDLKLFSEWLTDPWQPCRVFRPDLHDELWSLEHMVPAPHFSKVENKQPLQE